MEKNKLIKILKTALISRSLDERIWMLNRQGRAAIAASGQGHEISQLGCVEALDSIKDHFLIYYRQFTLMLALGTTPEEQLRNFLAKEGDIMSGARQFPLHGSHPRVDLFSFSNVVATQLPQAVGVALADKMNNKDSVTIVFFGDGAASQGDCHEAMNFASIHKLPVIFFCENNGYAISVPLEKQMNIESIASRSSAYNMPGVQVDGTDFFSVYDVTKEAATLAREGGGPTLIESKVERLLPHTTDDDHTKYRSQSDIEFMSQRDPIQLEKEATLVINQATEKVEDEPFPSIDNMLLHSDLNKD